MSWISVKDRLPEPKNKNEQFAVYCFNQDGLRFVAAEYFMESQNKFFGSGGFFTVTHWQPLPEPPKDES